MKKILVPTDFSDNANNALVFAIQLANRFDCAITLLHTYKVYSTTGSFKSVKSYVEEDAARSLLELVEKYGDQLKNKDLLDSKLSYGDPISLIANIAEKQGYSLIVMGTKGASGMLGEFMGSVTHGLVKKTITPILAIPENAPYHDFKQAVFAVDQRSISSPKVTAVLTQLMRKYEGVVRVYHLDTGKADVGIDPSVDMFLEGVTHSFHYDLTGDPQKIPASIDQFSREYKADLLCLLRRRRGFFEQLFHRSTTSHEAFHSDIPVLILHDD